MSDLPDFVREALESGSEEETLADPVALEAVAGLAAVAGADASAAALWARLSSAVEATPLRYAPFFDHISDLFGLDEAGVMRELERAADDQGWSLTPFPGVRLFRVRAGAAIGSREAYLVRLANGARVPRHRHPGEEVTLVLEGGYRDSSGREFHAGDLVRSSAGEDFHSQQVIGNEGCFIAMQFEKRFVFESIVHRAILNLFWS